MSQEGDVVPLHNEVPPTILDATIINALKTVKKDCYAHYVTNNDPNHPSSQSINALNQYLQILAELQKTLYIIIGPPFVIPTDIHTILTPFPTSLHPSIQHLIECIIPTPENASVKKYPTIYRTFIRELYHNHPYSF
jgi:hypothetical protein